METSDFNSISGVFLKAHEDAILNNKSTRERWQQYKKENEDVQSRLKLFIKSLRVPVMIPIGNKAMFRGELVHTNDIFVTLGCGYIVKGSVDYALELCCRRIVRCDDILKKLEEERKLLENRVNISHLNAFSSLETPEIVEPFLEEEERKWREDHQKKVRTYKQKLAEIRKTESDGVQTEEELWKRLDLLEMQEELEDELDRMGIGDEGDYSDRSSSSECSPINEDTAEEEENCEDDKNEICSEPSNVTNESVVCESPYKICTSVDSDIIIILFKHSKVLPCIEPHDNIINSPYDIYSRHSLAMRRIRKPFKRVSFAEPASIIVLDDSIEDHTISPQSAEDFALEDDCVEVFGNVSERDNPDAVVAVEKEDSRPISKFKQSRNRKKQL